MKNYVKKTITIEAIQWLGEQSFKDLYNFADADNNYGVVGMKNGRGDIAQIRTDKGIIDVQPEEFIIKEANGSLYSCEPASFKKIFDLNF